MYLCVCVLSMYLYVCNSDFLKVTKKKNSAGECSTGTVQQLLKLNSLRFFNKGFVHYLLHDLLTSNAIVACSRLIICLQQISLRHETWINTTGTAAAEVNKLS